MKFRRNVIWLVIWVGLAGAFGLLDAYGYDLYTMPSGVSVSRTVTIICAILAGYQLGVLTIKGSVKVQRGAPGEVGMLSSLLRVGAWIAIVAAILALFGALFHENVTSVTINDAPKSFVEWTQTPYVSWPAANCVRGMLRVCDLPDVLKVLGGKVTIVGHWGPRMA